MDKVLEEFLINNDYTDLCEINGQICGLHRFAFTTGLVVNMTFDSYERRYCFEHRKDAIDALRNWDGKNHPTGPWIKVKGQYEGRPIDSLNPLLDV